MCFGEVDLLMVFQSISNEPEERHSKGMFTKQLPKHVGAHPELVWLKNWPLAEEKSTDSKNN